MAATARLKLPLTTSLRLYIRRTCPASSRQHVLQARQCRPISHTPSSRTPVDPVTYHRLEAERRAYYQRRSYYAAGGAAVCMLATLLLVTLTDIPRKERNDAPDHNTLNSAQSGAPIIQDKDTTDDVHLVQTGTSTVPTFPRIIQLPDGDGSSIDGKADYQLLGLGIRTVSFLSIQVYVVGLYIATEDVAALQQALIRKIDPIATTLIKPEKDSLRALLLDPEKSEEIWQHVLKDNAMRTAIRVVPVRNTDFQHLRDGWVRSITARTTAPASAGHDEYGDEGFGRAMQKFKSTFSSGSRKGVPKGKILILARDQPGKLTVWYNDGEPKNDLQKMGIVEDERISRLVWMGYLAGKKVATEGARLSIADGLLDIVERPIGTVANQVL